jgi:hypothetical protein
MTLNAAACSLAMLGATPDIAEAQDLINGNPDKLRTGQMSSRTLKAMCYEAGYFSRTSQRNALQRLPQEIEVQHQTLRKEQLQQPEQMRFEACSMGIPAHAGRCHEHRCP